MFSVDYIGHMRETINPHICEDGLFCTWYMYDLKLSVHKCAKFQASPLKTDIYMPACIMQINHPQYTGHRVCSRKYHTICMPVCTIQTIVHSTLANFNYIFMKKKYVWQLPCENGILDKLPPLFTIDSSWTSLKLDRIGLYHFHQCLAYKPQ